jgi:phosphinothricin acetyltransferase
MTPSTAFSALQPAIERARPHDLAGIQSLLRACKLPVAGLSELPELALVIHQGPMIVGSAVIEPYGDAGLLRSIAVESSLRGTGLGHRLVDAALGLARERNIRDVFLLTETAPSLFARMGFQPTVRSRVPPAVRQSVEFASACPASARAMHLPLTATPPAQEHVRAATGREAAQIAEIYNQGITDRLGTFETRLRSERDVLAWFDGAHPVVVVARASGGIVAFAATSTYRPRECYSGIAEFSVYVARDERGRGFGRQAMAGLMDAASAAGFWKLVSRVFVDNAASRGLMASMGFREVGVYEKHGRLDGRWRDVVIVERLFPENLD